MAGSAGRDWLAWSIVAGVLALAGALAFALYPRQLVIAVGRTEWDEPKVVQLLIENLARDRSDVRLTPMWTGGTSASAEALANGKADLAVTRSEVDVPAGTTSIVSLRKFLPVVFTHDGKHISKVTDLRGKRIGIREGSELNVRLARRILAHWGLGEADYQFVPLTPAEQIRQARSGAIDAYFSIDAVGAKPSSSLNDTIEQAWGKKPVVVAFDDADALVLEIRGVETADIVKGVFGGDPAKPPEDIRSITVSNRIVARESVSVNDAVTLTKALLSLRDKRQADTPEVLAIERPARDLPTLPIHPGTLQLLDGVYEDFLNRYTNHIFIAMALLGGFGSIWTVLSAHGHRVSRARAVGDVQTLCDLGDLIATAADRRTIADQLRTVDEVFKNALIAAAGGQLNPAALASIQAAVQRCQRAAELRSASIAPDSGAA